MNRVDRRLAARTQAVGHWWLVCAATLWLLAAAPAQAAPPQPRALSQYEKDSIALALKRVKGERELNPEGKRVESIEVVPLDMVDDRDPWPNVLNFFHYTTRPYVIQREVLLKVGQPFALTLADETERNLRALIQLSVVLIVPLKGSKPDTVRILVVTKDVLSLRFNWEPRFVNGKLDYLFLQPSEQNVLGTHNAVAGSLEFTTHTYAIGGSLSIPRIAGSHINAFARAAAIVNCDTGGMEGSNGYFGYGQPLFSTRAKWAWQTALAWSDRIVRPTSAGGEWICRGGTERPYFVTTAQNQRISIPDRFAYNSLSGNAVITRSFGQMDKYDFSFGAEAERRGARVEPPAASEVQFENVVADAGVPLERPSYCSDVDRDQERGVVGEPGTSSDLTLDTQYAMRVYEECRLPRRDMRTGPFVQLRAHRNAFHRLINNWTLGLQEDYALGHDVLLKLYPALQAWGSTRSLFGTVASLGYTWPIESGFLRARGTSRIEFSRVEQSDASLDANLHFVTPELGIGRLVANAQVVRRYINYLNPGSSLGGTDRLRGYRPGAFLGSNLVVGNIEYRTVPIEVLSVLVGGALFYDIGDAFYETNQIELKSGAGAGLRFGFPQLQRSVFRVDAGFPLNRSEPQGELTVVAEFAQAVNVP